MTMFPAVMLLSSFCLHPVIEAGKEYGLYQSVSDTLLRSLAEDHARSMATRQHQDHRGWERRFRLIHEGWDVSLKDAREICAESWPGESAEEAAAGCWEDWKTSPGHWSVANGNSTRYGVAMARGENGIWYICVIAVWERP